MIIYTYNYKFLKKLKSGGHPLSMKEILFFVAILVCPDPEHSGRAMCYGFDVKVVKSGIF